MLTHRFNLPLAALAFAACFMASSCSALENNADGGAVVESPEATNSDGTAALPPGSFKVVGKDIVAPDGNVFVPVGANVGAPLSDSAGAAVWLFRLNGHDITSTESVAAVDAWGWNFLRVNAQCRGSAANENNAAWGHVEMFAAIDKVVDAYTAKGVVVMIDCHDFTETEGVAATSPEYAATTEFWKAAAQRYGDNGHVWFNHLNEFAKFGETVEAWQAVVDDGYQMFTATGTDNLVAFDLPVSAQDLPTMLNPAIQEWAKTKCNVIWDWHAYGGVLAVEGDPPDQAAFEAEMNRVVAAAAEAQLPLLIGEVGYDWDVSRKKANSGSFAKERLGALTALAAAPANGYGVVTWHANGDSGTQMAYGLKNSNDLTFADPNPTENLSEFGQAFLSYSQNSKALGPQAGPTTESCQR